MSLAEYAPGPQEPQYWYNLRTGQVEEGAQDIASHLWGPFASRAEAENALEIAKKRNEAWDQDGWND
ncbi:MAG: SPOR domain-containing protein [Rothia sp. (in: high G+C Gram-positive bacteria)]|nr:SPOR domain-containing protein [Rothia sp. (in: high G+C Gram-positive bacteria)]